jgi:3-dehydroquinate synthetase
MTSPAEPSPGEQRRSVRVDLGPRAYDVLIGRGLLKQIPGLMEERGLKGPFVVITDHRVAQNYRVAWEKILTGAGLEYSFLDVPPGEESKSLTEFSRLLSELAKLKVPRSGTILALGGGVVGDLAGYVAASYLRGIACVQIPTTLLAMVDSSVGGKTGLNLPEGKNLAGAFHQPKLVVADLNTLKTLPAREFSAGMAEVIKYGAIAKRGLFDRVAKGVTGTQRALLNFGHTVGHAIERATGYKVYLHGEAIALGMRAAAWLSVWHAGLPETKARKIEAALSKNGLPVTLKAGVDRGAILAALGNDKKVASDGKNRWVLLNKLGEARGGWELTGDGVEKAVELLY